MGLSDRGISGSYIAGVENTTCYNKNPQSPSSNLKLYKKSLFSISTTFKTTPQQYYEEYHYNDKPTMTTETPAAWRGLCW